MPSPIPKRSSFSAIFLSFALSAIAAEPLPALDAERTATVSGLSSGGYMAVQLHVAHSATVKGAGVIAGGPYYCAQGSVFAAYFNCRQPGFFAPLPRIETLRAEAQARASAGQVDALGHLAGSTAWLFSGTRDAEVERDVMTALLGFYQAVKADAVLVGDRAAGHGMPTAAEGSPEQCAATRPPFINPCGYDAAGELLQRLHGKLAPPGPAQSGRLVTFDQAPFGGRDISMSETGYVYIPSACEKSRCAVHVAFHGCRQKAEQFARDAGYNRWADANRMIVLYPQVIARTSWALYNPRGCWDWWGYTGREYHTKAGAQIRAVKAMLERLSAPRK